MSPTARERYRELSARVDAFFAKTLARHQDRMQCATGCFDCCQSGLTVTQVEAAEIADHLRQMPEERRAQVARRAARTEEQGCSALDEQGRCMIYEARPLVCRSHGVPIKTTPEKGQLPLISSCPRNFGGGVDFAAVAPDAVLDQTTLSTILAALEAAYSVEVGVPRGERVAIRDLLCGGGASRAS